MSSGQFLPLLKIEGLNSLVQNISLTTLFKDGLETTIVISEAVAVP